MDCSIRLPPHRLCPAENMKAFGEYSLSPPRGPDCCVSTRNAVPMNIRSHEPARVISMGMAQDAGFRLVPDAVSMRYMPASFICADAQAANKSSVGISLIRSPCKKGERIDQ